MTRSKASLLILVAVAAVAAAVYGAMQIRRGFSAADEPSVIEAVMARAMRRMAVPSRARDEKNPLTATPELIEEGRRRFNNQCASCHGTDGTGRTAIGRGLYPKAPDLSLSGTQELTDGEIHHVIRNGVRLTGMPAWGPYLVPESDVWKLVLFIRNLRPLTPAERTQQASVDTARYVGSPACEKCHESIFRRWVKTPMANVIRDPREHPEAITPDLSTNTIAPFTKDDVAFVYGSIWKQRYFKKVGDDYFPLSAQWDFAAKVWRPYKVTTEWWVPFYPDDNMQRPTGPTCDGCHSVNYDIRTKQVAEWNVGCERCHGPGSAHVAQPTRGNILCPSRMDFVPANDNCIQCHSQGQPLTNPIEGRYYDWPVGYRVGLKLADFWKLEEHTLGETTFTHFPDGTAHKNRMQGNDFVQSVMYRRGVTCSSCHDAHGTENYAELRQPANDLCLGCHGPNSVNGPRESTLVGHTHHRIESTGSQCVECHMPRIQTTIGTTAVRAHTFVFITPAMTDRYKIPNPCTSCHKDKTTAWAADALRRWPEVSPWRTE